MDLFLWFHVTKQLRIAASPKQGGRAGRETASARPSVRRGPLRTDAGEEGARRPSLGGGTVRRSRPGVFPAVSRPAGTELTPGACAPVTCNDPLSGVPVEATAASPRILPAGAAKLGPLSVPSHLIRFRGSRLLWSRF